MKAHAATRPRPGRRCRATSKPTAASFDLREAFARDPGRFAALWCRGAPRSSPTCRRTSSTPRRCTSCSTWRASAASRRTATRCSPAQPINPTEGRAVLHTALRAPRGQGPFSDEVHGVLDAMLAYVETVRDTAGSGIRHVVNIGIGGSDLGPQMVVPALDAFVHPGLTLHFVSNVDGHDITPVLRRLEPERHAVHHRQQDLHDAGDHGQRAGRARLVPRQRRHRHREALRRRPPPTSRPRPSSASRPPSASGTGSAGAIRCGRRSGCRSRSPIGADHFRALLAGAHAMDRHFAERAAGDRTCRCCSACSTSGTATSTASRAAASRPTTRA